jgi:DNA mismatch endonuclease Vsr
MARIHSKNTKCELMLEHALRQSGIRRIKRHYAIVGTPDFAIPSLKLAVFCDSDFWHGLKGVPQTNKAYWAKKLERNRLRDLEVNKELRRTGWTVMRVKESAILADPKKVAKRVLNFVNSA